MAAIRATVLLLCLTCSVVLFASDSYATSITASFSPSIRNADAVVGFGTVYGQTFTATEAGYLTQIDLFTQLVASTPVRIDILPTTRRDSTYFPVRDWTRSLGHVEIATPGGLTGFGFVGLDLSSWVIPVEVGDVLAIVARSSRSFDWYGDSGGLPYSGGSMWSGTEAGLLTSSDNSIALGFRAYVSPQAPTPVPEPATATLILVGGAAIAVRRRILRR